VQSSTAGLAARTTLLLLGMMPLNNLSTQFVATLHKLWHRLEGQHFPHHLGAQQLFVITVQNNFFMSLFELLCTSVWLLLCLFNIMCSSSSVLLLFVVAGWCATHCEDNDVTPKMLSPMNGNRTPLPVIINSGWAWSTRADVGSSTWELQFGDDLQNQSLPDDSRFQAHRT
jgi:hypothetical protein